MFGFPSSSAFGNLLIMAIGGAAIWIAGAKLERLADAVAEWTGLGKAFIGGLLLAIASSLPEIAAVTTAALHGDTQLAVHNLFGSVVLNTAILAAADVVFGRDALSHKSAYYSLLIQGVGVVGTLAVALVGMSLRIPVAEFTNAAQVNSVLTVWMVCLLGTYLLTLYASYHGGKNRSWRPVNVPRESRQDNPDHKQVAEGFGRTPVRYGFMIIGACAVILAAGYAVAVAGGALAEQSGLGQTFVGFALVALATSLPELSVTVSAARARRFEAAFSNVFGSNAFTVALLALVALIAGGEATFRSLSASAHFAVSMGICLTCVYLWGLLERSDRTIWRMGYDSIVVVILSIVGLAGVYWIK